MNKIIILIFLSSFLMQDVFCDLRLDPLVETKLGSIRGVRATNGNYSMYMGIRYARVDESNPFGTAIPEPPFEDVVDANDDTIMCPQLRGTTLTGSLDCLRLNVYVPDSASSSNRLPVLFWIHGGAFKLGSGGRNNFGPSFLVRHDVILVTTNYRVGVYGFMCLDTPEVPGNQGFKDQLLALRWVNENIDAFGGDPNQITIFGESAGGISVDFHLLFPEEKLFSKAILQSGTSLLPTFSEPVKDSAVRLAKYLGHETDDLNDAISFLASTDPHTLVYAGETLNIVFRTCLEKEFSNVDGFVTENWITKTDVSKVRNIPILAGFTDDEMLHDYVLQEPAFFERFTFYEKLELGFDIHNEVFAGMEEIIRRFYIGDEPISGDVRFELADFESDFKHNHPTFRSITRFLENAVSNIFFYVFSYTGGRNLSKYRLNTTLGGAFHGDELAYLFDNPAFRDTPTPEDQLVIDWMTTMWANFAKYGDPTPETSNSLPVKWTPLNKGTPQHYLDIGSELTMKIRPFTMRMTFWDLFYKMNDDLQHIYPGAFNGCYSVHRTAFAVLLLAIPIILFNNY